MDVVVNKLTTVSAKWETFGKQIGADDYTLEDIRSQHSDPADCMKELIREWLKLERLCTWSHIVLALKNPNVGESQLGEYLEETYLQGELSHTFTTACIGGLFR